ncbi:angiotensin-converting enzyme-like isoform X2 [Acanthaster planci]|uniref:Angiotensin-converting enzyme n=1 Tax=Acanthaster planci TaxID=133434 RepID=A0A8B7XWP3_ACAPL|nr:angiotensin-converting enzyme-like isoform X2 [Acanthaster planci]
MSRVLSRMYLSLLLALISAKAGSSLQQARESDPITDQNEANEFLRHYTEQAQIIIYAGALASWGYYTNVTAYNQQKDVEASLVSAAFRQEAYQNASRFDVSGFDEDVKRQFQKIKDIGTAALEPSKVEEYNNVVNKMTDNYSAGTVCKEDQPTECLQLEPGLAHIMATSTNWDELVWAWKGFRDAVGTPNKPLYKKFVKLANEAAVANGHADMGAYWRSDYESATIVDEAYKIYDQILPLYQQLHAYVRRIMHKTHGSKVDVKGKIPSCLLGDMWGRFWGNIFGQVVPYPDRPNIDVTDTMVAKNFTPRIMFELADDFFASLGLLRVNPAFWSNSMIVKPKDGRQVVCHPSAWDLGNGEDFRVKMCTEVTMDFFQTIHHELGHTQYQMQYSDLPFPFRDGANGAFHEAVGEVMTLSISTPAHLSHPDIGLLEPGSGTDEETDINFLLKTALNTIGTLPFSLALDQWRWDVFAGDISEDKWTERWWQLKHDLVGTEAPVSRTEDDFDPGAMYHIVVAYPFLGYYMRTIIQFQFQKALCDAAGHTGPLHRCDFYKSQEAGTKFANMLKLGCSKPWPDAMEAITGQRAISADAINAYFEPLMTWLTETNRKNGEQIGWKGNRGFS